MADVAAENEADSGSGGPSNTVDGTATPEEELDRNDTDRVTGEFSKAPYFLFVLCYIIFYCAFKALYFLFVLCFTIFLLYF